MRIHTNTATAFTIEAAARVARVDITRCNRHESRSHQRAYDVLLEGASTRRPNSGVSGAGSGYAATRDQWGYFLAHLFSVDNTIKAGPYNGERDFSNQTFNAYPTA